MNEWDRAYMNARRFPRTLEDAFGPGHRSSYGIEPMPDSRKVPAHEVVLYVVAVLAVAAILIFKH